MKLLVRFLRIDWCVLHGHTPFQIAAVSKSVAQQPRKAGDVLVEAGCWQGGSTAKWSILCKELGIELAVFDSFEGVGDAEAAPGEHDFTGEYASAETVVRGNILRYGEIGVLHTYPGWFSHSMRPGKLRFTAVGAYIDCDTAKGTKDALAGLIPVLADGASVFSQDAHIPSVASLIADPETWSELGAPEPTVARLDRRLVRLDFPPIPTRASFS